jgi:recombination DNA repair RAD52 pathway protein
LTDVAFIATFYIMERRNQATLRNQRVSTMNSNQHHNSYQIERRNERRFVQRNKRAFMLSGFEVQS